MLTHEKVRLLSFLIALTGSVATVLAGSVAGQAPSSLDFQTYRSRIEPIFLKARPGGVRCYDCHSVLVTRLRLQPFPQGSSSWSEEQSRRNFDVVSALVNVADPLKSPLLLHPLAQEAGGDPTHTGGKFWTTRNDPEWKVIADWVGHHSSDRASDTAAPVAASPVAASHSISAATLDFQYFRSKVEPIFLKERPSHARCYACHSEPRRAFHLERLTSGSIGWTEQQSRVNFQNVLQQVAPGDPASSRFVMHTLAPESGGDASHSGGRQFETQNDPDWLTLAEWVRGAQASPPPAPPGASLIFITNSAGNTVDVIDPATNKIVQVIRGVETPHGVSFSPNGARVYISNETERALDVVDRKSGAMLKKIPLTGRPNNLAVTKDGGRVLIGIWETPGAIDIVDAASLERVRSIPLKDSVHNVYVTPDGKYAASGSIEGKVLTLIDLASEKVVAEIKFDSGVRPLAFETNPDG